MNEPEQTNPAKPTLYEPTDKNKPSEPTQIRTNSKNPSKPTNPKKPSRTKQNKSINSNELTWINQSERIKPNEPTQAKQLKPRIRTISPKRLHSNKLKQPTQTSMPKELTRTNLVGLNVNW